MYKGGKSVENVSIYLLAVAILLPIISGIICYFVPNSSIRNFLVAVSGAALLVVSCYLAFIVYTGETQRLEIHKLFGFIDLEKLIMVLDFSLLLYIIYLGIKHSRSLLILLGLLQLVPLVFFESKFDIVAPTHTFIIDRLGVIMLLVVSVIGSAIAFYAIGYMKKHEHHLHLKTSRQPRFFAIILIFLGAMNALVLANDILWMYFFWEITTLCSFLLISHDNNEESINNALRALWMNSLGGVAFVAAILTAWFTLNTVAINEIIAKGSGSGAAVLVAMSFLCFAGFTKSAQFPFQSWLLGAMVAPTPVSALLHSSTMVKAGVYIVVRFSPVFAGTLLGKIVAIVGAFTFLAGAAVAISQRNAKRVLAYSTIANLGLIICAAGMGSKIGLGIAILLIIMHAISKALLFLCVGTVEQEIESRDIEDMQGLMKRMPFTASIMVLGMISMLLPPFGVFLTKWMAIEASIGSPIVLLFLVMGSAFTVVFWSQWIGTLLTMSYRKEFKDEELPFTVKSTLSFLILLTFVASIMVVQIYNVGISRFVEGVSMNNAAMNTASVIEGDRVGLFLKTNEIVWGGFPVFMFFGLFLIILALIPVYFARTKESQVRKPYLCGENTDEMKGVEAYMPGDKVEAVIVRNYYMQSFFSEQKLTFWLNLSALAIILVMFGVVINV